MLIKVLFCVVLLTLGCSRCVYGNEDELSVRVPGVAITRNNEYICFAVKAPNAYVVGFDPKNVEGVTHHMLLYQCEQPPEIDTYWHCGEMHVDESDHKPTCNGNSNIMYAWAHHAAKLELPDDVGFAIGENAGVDYIVIQVHYGDIMSLDEPVDSDTSGVVLKLTSTPQDKLAGVYLMGTAGSIPPQKPAYYMDTACLYNEGSVLHPFAYRTHAHNLGFVVSGYVVKDGEWIEIGRKNPQDPQMFYDVTDISVDVERGDWLAARCTMNSCSRDRVTYIGSTMEDEMCNFYMMYYTESNDLPVRNNCFNVGFSFTDEDDIGQTIPDTVSQRPSGEEPKSSCYNNDDDKD